MEQRNTSGQAVSFSIVMVVLALLTVVIPFSSKIKSTTTRRAPLILRTESELALLKGDRDNNNTPDWKDLVLETMSTTTREAAKNAPTDPATLARLNDPNNLTSSFSKNIFTASAYVAQNPTISEEDQATLISGLIEKEGVKIKTKEYSLEDITLSRDNSSGAQIKYGNFLAQTLKKAAAYNLGSDDLAPLARFNESKDEEDLSGFATKSENVQRVISGLLTVPVPSSAAIFHLNLINSLSIYSSALDAFADTKNDPLKSVAFFNSYEQTVFNILKSMAALKNYFNLEQVPFTPADAGYGLIIKK